MSKYLYVANLPSKIALGYFDKKDDAIKCRLKAEKYYFGEFSSQNRNK